MSSFAVLLLATPVFGMTLQPPSIEPIVDPVAFGVVAGIAAANPALLLQDEAEASEGGAAHEAAPADENVSPAKAAKGAAQDQYREDARTRNSLAKIHRPLGIATWIAMTAAVTLGFIQYYNRYGFFADQGSNPCVKGDAIFG